MDKMLYLRILQNFLLPPLHVIAESTGCIVVSGFTVRTCCREAAFSCVPVMPFGWVGTPVHKNIMMLNRSPFIVGFSFMICWLCDRFRCLLLLCVILVCGLACCQSILYGMQHSIELLIFLRYKIVFTFLVFISER
jgi:hypothetical protein